MKTTFTEQVIAILEKEFPSPNYKIKCFNPKLGNYFTGQILVKVNSFNNTLSDYVEGIYCSVYSFSSTSEDGLDNPYFLEQIKRAKKIGESKIKNILETSFYTYKDEEIYIVFKNGVAVQVSSYDGAYFNLLEKF